MASSSGPLARVVYRSLAQVWDILGSQSHSNEVKTLTGLCLARGLMDKESGMRMADTVRVYPFVVIEGLDGTGKTTLTRYLSEKLGMKLIPTPPKIPEFQESRTYFDAQSESVRRAYYSLGNYVAAQDVVDSREPVVMDRFWHSTAAYAMAHLMKYEGSQPEAEDFLWPDDLLKPDLVIFLQVSEQERMRRHMNRKDFTNTQEEQTLAKNEAFRQCLLELYRKISGPKFLELNVDGDQPSVEAKILRTVCDHFPVLQDRSFYQHAS